MQIYLVLHWNHIAQFSLQWDFSKIPVSCIYPGKIPVLKNWDPGGKWNPTGIPLFQWDPSRFHWDPGGIPLIFSMGMVCTCRNITSKTNILGNVATFHKADILKAFRWYVKSECAITLHIQTSEILRIPLCSLTGSKTLDLFIKKLKGCQFQNWKKILNPCIEITIHISNHTLNLYVYTHDTSDLKFGFPWIYLQKH
jgi:hypothetical protein